MHSVAAPGLVFSPDELTESGAGFVYFEPYGGLANRMRVLASFAALSQRVASPVFFHWIHGVGGEVGASFAQLFQPLAAVAHVERWQAVDRVQDLCSRNPLRRWRHRRHNRAQGVDLLLRDWDAPGVKIELQLPSLLHLPSSARALVHTCHAFGDYSSHLRMLRPVASIKEQLDALAESHGFGAAAVGVHVRRTDNELARRHSPLEAFEMTMARELCADPDTWFFLCTDDPEVEDQLKTRFPGKILVLEKVLHRDSEAGMESALLDLFLLARTRRVLGSYWSSFSQVASGISGIPLELVGAGQA